MIKKNLKKNEKFLKKFFLSLKKNKKILKKKNNKILLKKKSLKKNKKFLKKFLLKKNYNKFKILNLYKFKKKFYMNFFNRFFDILFWAFFLSLHKKQYKLTYSLKKFLFINNNFNYFKKINKKEKIKFFLFLDKLNYCYILCLLTFKKMFKLLIKEQKLQKKQKEIFFKLKKKNKNLKYKKKYYFKIYKIGLLNKTYLHNFFNLNYSLNRWRILKKKNLLFKILIFFRKSINNKKYFNVDDKVNLKNKFYKKNKKFWIKKKINKYLTNFVNNNEKILNSNSRSFYYDFFFLKFEKNLNLLKKKFFVPFLWKKNINKTFLRFRLSEYIFLLLLSYNTKKFVEPKKFYILNFYKILIFLKKNLKNFKKYLLKKKYFINILKKKNINYLYKKEYIIKNYFNTKFSKNLGKFIFKYYSMLKYFNKLLFFFSKNLNFELNNIIISNYKKFVDLSFLVNVTKNNKNYVSLVSLNNYFMQKTNKSYINSWLLNDKIFNFVEIFDKKYNKDLYWNKLFPFSNLAKRDLEKSYMMIPNVSKNLYFKYAYFFGKNLKKNLQFVNKVNFLFFYFIIFFKWNYLYRCYFVKYYFLKFIEFKFNIIFFKKNYFISYNFLNILKIKNLLNFNIINKNMFLKKFIFLKLYYLKKKFLSLKYYNLIKKKIFLFKLFIWFLYFIFKQNYILKKNKLKFLNFKNIQKYFKGSGNILNLKQNITQKNLSRIILPKKYNVRSSFLNIYNKYYVSYHYEYNKVNIKKCILHFIEKKTNNFLVLSLFSTRRVIGHTSAGQGMYRAYNNSKRQKKGTGILGKILFRKLRLRARKYGLKEVFLKSNLYWNFRINYLTKYWVLRYKLGVPYLKGLKLGLGLPYHKGLRLANRRRK